LARGERGRTKKFVTRWGEQQKHDIKGGKRGKKAHQSTKQSITHIYCLRGAWTMHRARSGGMNLTIQTPKMTQLKKAVNCGGTARPGSFQTTGGRHGNQGRWKSEKKGQIPGSFRLTAFSPQEIQACPNQKEDGGWGGASWVGGGCRVGVGRRRCNFAYLLGGRASLLGLQGEMEGELRKLPTAWSNRCRGPADPSKITGRNLCYIRGDLGTPWY